MYEVWDDGGRLAYVGIADDFARRWRQHIEHSWWMGEITVAYVDEKVFSE
jgi:predicted GIY-YIG superfamily endonuclease